MSLPLCAQCLTAPVKRRDKRYCSTACRDLAGRKPLPRCPCGQPVTRHQHRYCSLACGHQSLLVRRPFCAAQCGERVKQRKSRYCSKSCAWQMRGGREAARKGRVKAAQVRRQQYIIRLRERLKGMTTVAQVWQLAYKRGYTACNAAWRRKVERGEVIQVKERTRGWHAA